MREVVEGDTQFTRFIRTLGLTFLKGITETIKKNITCHTVGMHLEVSFKVPRTTF